MKNHFISAWTAVFFCLTWAAGGPVLAKSNFFADNCSRCHADDSTTCNGCHRHGASRLSATTDATQYESGDTIRVTFEGGTQRGWIRAYLYDQHGFEIDQSSGPSGTGDDGKLTELADLSFPVTLSAPAPAEAGHYTWSVSWFGSDDGERGHIESEPVSTNEFKVTGGETVPPEPEVVPPEPKVAVNGSDSRVTVSTGEVVTVKVSLDPGSLVDQSADWWVAADTPFGLYWYTLSGERLIDRWVESDTPVSVYGGPLFDLAPFTIFESTLPSGRYVFYFGIDDNMDGTLVLNETFVHFVEVIVE